MENFNIYIFIRVKIFYIESIKKVLNQLNFTYNGCIFCSLIKLLSVFFSDWKNEAFWLGAGQPFSSGFSDRKIMYYFQYIGNLHCMQILVCQ